MPTTGLAILIEQTLRIAAESHILTAQLLQFEDNRLHKRRRRDGVIHARLHVATAELDRVEERMQSDVPPDFFRVVDAIGRNANE
jgi:hypothetical protein